jgi:putative pantetheine hydrolase
VTGQEAVTGQVLVLPGSGPAVARPWGALTDVPGTAVGHAQRIGDGWLTGVTVVLPPPGTVGAVDVRGGGPATRETDTLAPSTLVSTVDAVCLSGGSAYGLAAADGVQRWCEENGRGFGVGPPDDPRRLLVPIVPAAAVFDLGRGGDPSARPDAELGRQAAAAAAGGGGFAVGSVGAGTGARIAAGSLRGGVGTASVRVPTAAGHVMVGALAVVNAFGSPVADLDGALLGRAFVPPGLARPGTPTAEQAAAVRRLAEQAGARQSRAGQSRTGQSRAEPSLAAAAAPRPRANTTLAVVATDAALDPARTWRLAASGHDGFARALRPVHTLVDGDVVFALATGSVPVGAEVEATLQAAAADAVMLAIMDAVLAARAMHIGTVTVPGYLDLCPDGALPLTPS